MKRQHTCNSKGHSPPQMSNVSRLCVLVLQHALLLPLLSQSCRPDLILNCSVSNVDLPMYHAAVVRFVLHPVLAGCVGTIAVALENSTPVAQAAYKLLLHLWSPSWLSSHQIRILQAEIVRQQAHLSCSRFVCPIFSKAEDRLACRGGP